MFNTDAFFPVYFQPMVGWMKGCEIDNRERRAGCSYRCVHFNLYAFIIYNHIKPPAMQSSEQHVGSRRMNEDTGSAPEARPRKLPFLTEIFILIIVCSHSCKE